MMGSALMNPTNGKNQENKGEKIVCFVHQFNIKGVITKEIDNEDFEEVIHSPCNAYVVRKIKRPYHNHFDNIHEQPDHIKRILDALKRGEVTDEEVQEIFEELQELAFRKRSKDDSRLLWSYLRKEGKDSALFIIHSTRMEPGLDQDFEKTNISFIKDKILRVFKYTYYTEKKELDVRFREKSQSKIFSSLYSLPVDVDNGSLVSTYDTPEGDIEIYVEDESARFQAILYFGQLSFLRSLDQNRIELRDNGIGRTVQIKTNNDKYIVDLIRMKFNAFEFPELSLEQFVEVVRSYTGNYQEEHIRTIIQQIEEAKRKYGLVPVEKPFQELIKNEKMNYKIVEEETYIQIAEGEGIDDVVVISRIEKKTGGTGDIDERWGIFLFIDEVIILSKSYLKKLAAVLYRRGEKKVWLVSLEFHPSPINIGNYEIYNELNIKGILPVIKQLQKAFKDAKGLFKRQMTSISIACFIYMYLESNTVGKKDRKDYIATRFFKRLYKYALLTITKINKAGVKEDGIFEAKRMDILLKDPPRLNEKNNRETQENELAEDSQILNTLYDYWKSKRKKTKKVCIFLIGVDEGKNKIQYIDETLQLNEEKKNILEQKFEEKLRDSASDNLPQTLSKFEIIKTNKARILVVFMCSVEV